MSILNKLIKKKSPIKTTPLFKEKRGGISIKNFKIPSSPNFSIKKIEKEPEKQPEKKGLDGRNGIDGKDGRDGSPDTAQQIRDKLQSLVGDERLNKDAIKDLEQWIRDLVIRLIPKQERRFGGGGGGMGNVYHETFAISAGTTTITTAHPIAGSGNAIFKAAYQGQETDKDVHYTVGSDFRTITFDSGVQAQFQNNTTFSMTYIRG